MTRTKSKIKHMNLPVMKIGLLITVCTFFFISCNKDDSIQNLELLKLEELKEKYHGKYELISSVSEKAVDLNNDGITSNDLVSENSMILFSTIEMLIPDENDLFLEYNEFCFVEFWATENSSRIKTKEVISTTIPPIHNALYDIYSTISFGRFEDDLKPCKLSQGSQEKWKNTLIESQSLEIGKNETIKVTTIRKLYTMEGWITTKIESKYKRYTIIT